MTQEASTQNGHYVEANGLNIYYEEFGSGEPLVLMHGGRRGVVSILATVPNPVKGNGVRIPW
jgi:hypothetical protein